jgi:hypothetical protein
MILSPLPAISADTCRPSPPSGLFAARSYWRGHGIQQAQNGDARRQEAEKQAAAHRAAEKQKHGDRHEPTFWNQMRFSFVPIRLARCDPAQKKAQNPSRGVVCWGWLELFKSGQGNVALENAFETEVQGVLDG